MKTLASIVFFSLAGVTQVWATSTPQSLIGIDAYDPLQHAHLIVRGTVRDVVTERITLAEWGMADVGMENSTMTVTNIRVAISLVLRGELREDEVTFGAIGGLAPLFKVNHEYIVCAKWRSFSNGGVYVTSPYVGLYSKDDGSWAKVLLEPALEKSESLTDDEVRLRIQSASVASTVRSADVIARGRIKSVWQTQYTVGDGRRGELVHYALEVSELLKGHAPSKRIEFVVARASEYTPNWYRTVPLEILVGQEWFVFLRRGERGLYPFGGPNSLLRIEGESVIYDNVVEYSGNADEIDRLIRTETTNEP